MKRETGLFTNASIKMELEKTITSVLAGVNDVQNGCGLRQAVDALNIIWEGHDPFRSCTTSRTQGPCTDMHAAHAPIATACFPTRHQAVEGA